jgi:fido (protein-threonine AMPylation protein)
LSWDPYLDLRTGVLRNRLGLTDPVALAAAEADFTAARLAGLELRPVPGGYDLPHLQAFHRRIRWIALDPAENVRASVAAHEGDLGPMRAMLDRLVDGD